MKKLKVIRFANGVEGGSFFVLPRRITCPEYAGVYRWGYWHFWWITD